MAIHALVIICANALFSMRGFKEYSFFERYKFNINSLNNGDFKNPIKNLKAQMVKHSKKLEFEKADKIKNKLKSLENYQAKSTVVNSKISNVDVFSIFSDESYGYVNFFQVVFGSIIRSYTIEIKKKLCLLYTSDAADE